MANEKISPGTLMMQCLIWEPDPIAQRAAQDYSVVYNSTTIKTLPENIQRQLHTHDFPPYGVYLREKYIYRDTFLKIKNEFLQSDRADMLAENGTPLFTTGVPNFPYVDHQTFMLNGSLFSNTSVAPSALTSQNDAALDNSLSKWKYQERQIPFNHDGHVHGQNGDETNDHDYVADLGMQTCDEGFETALLQSSVKNKEYILYRKQRRFQPMQIAATSEQKSPTGASSGTNTGTTDIPKPIHWLCEKQTELYDGEDFFVEFARLAYASDTVPTSAAMTGYEPLDARLNNGNAAIIRNAGVVETNEQGQVVQQTVDTYNLRNQPYYIIELGRGDPDHNYFIILSYNANPIFVHVGVFPVLDLSSASNNPTIVMPPQSISRRLSVYKGASSKQLMDNEKVRIAVREHLGKLIITFSGYEGQPWIISRTDYRNASGASSSSSGLAQSNSQCGSPIKNYEELSVPMRIAGKKIQVGGGNVKCGFSFAPIHYEPACTFVVPNAITVRGPLTDSDLNLLLCEHVIIDDINHGIKIRVQEFFQDAEIFSQIINGDDCAVKKTPAVSRWPVKAQNTGKNLNVAGGSGNCGSAVGVFDLRNSDGLKISYIAIDNNSGLLDTPTEDINNDDGSESGDDAANNQNDPCSANTDTGGDVTDPNNQSISSTSKFVKWFTARYTLEAGDVEVGGQPNITGGPGGPQPSAKWRLTCCLTPIGTGWRMYVPPNAVGHGQPVVDVAHHVETFNHSWSYSDNCKIDHTGTIRFRLNLGTPTSLTNSLTTPTGTNDISSSTSGRSDMTTYLMSLADKGFFLRVYAWWKGGYMDCDQGCPCRSPSQPLFNGFSSAEKKRHCIFTGLAFGGEITIEGNTRFMECQIVDYMRIMQDQYFINSPFFDGMNHYHAVKAISNLAGFTSAKIGNDPFPPGVLIKDIADAYTTQPNNSIAQIPYINTGENLLTLNYTLPSGYDILQNPFMKFADQSKYDEALSKIGTLSSSVPYFDRFGVLRYDLRPDTLFIDTNGLINRTPKCNFFASPHALVDCANRDLLALNQYTYKRPVGDVVNEVMLVTATPQGEVLVKSELNYNGRYNASTPGFIGYNKRLLQMDGIFGSQKALETISKYYTRMVFKPPVIVCWESMGVPHLQSMDIVTFSGLSDDPGFPSQNVDTANQGALPRKTVTLILTSVSGEIIASRGEWRNKYEGEWLYGNVT